MNNIQADWVGLSREDYFHHEREVTGHCSECGEEVTHELRYDGERVCEECYKRLKGGEEEWQD